MCILRAVLVLFFVFSVFAPSTVPHNEYAGKGNVVSSLSEGSGTLLVEKKGPVQLPPLVIRADDTKVIRRQNLRRIQFLDVVASAPYPLASVEVEFTPDGYVQTLEPIFAPLVLTEYQREHALVFYSGEGFIEECFPGNLGVCIQAFTGLEYQLKRVYFHNGKKSKSGLPRVLVLVFGRREFST